MLGRAGRHFRRHAVSECSRVHRFSFKKQEMTVCAFTTDLVPAGYLATSKASTVRSSLSSECAILIFHGLYWSKSCIEDRTRPRSSHPAHRAGFFTLSLYRKLGTAPLTALQRDCSVFLPYLLVAPSCKASRASDLVRNAKG